MEYIGDIMNYINKLFIIVALIASIAFLTYPVNAELTFDQIHTFNVVGSMNDGSQLTVSPFPTGGTTTITTELNHLTFDFTTYKVITNLTLENRIRWFAGGSTYRNDILAYSGGGTVTKLVPLIASIEGTTYATGSIGWQKSPASVDGTYWIYYIQFDYVNTAYANTLSGVKTISLQYNKSVYWNAMGNRTGLYTDGGAGASACSGSILNGYINGGSYCLFGIHTFGYQQQATVHLTFNNISNSFGYINITKGNSNERLQTTDAENNIIYDSTSTSDDSQYTSKINGLNANVRDVATGLWWNSSILDASGNPFIPPELPPTLIINQNGVGIMFNSPTYSLNDIANISWIRTINTPLLCTDNVRLQTPDSKYDLVVSPSNSGYTKELLSLLGTYTVSFERDCLFSTSEVLASDSAFVGTTEQASYINVPAQVGVGQLFNVTYKIGWTKTSGSTVWLRDYTWDTTTGAYSTTYQSWALTGVKDVETNQSILITKLGKHLLKMCDVLQGCKASVTTNAYFNGTEITTNITYSNITLDKSSYSYGETMIIKYAVDNFNWSNKQISLVYYDVDEDIVQNQYYIQEQTEVVPLFISDLTFIGSGAAILGLVGTNDTGTYVLASAAFTLSALDTEGYGLSVTGGNCMGDIIQIKTTVPTGETGNLTVSADTVKYNKYYTINGSKTISYKYLISGTYYITLSVNGEAKRVIIKNVDNCGVVPSDGTYAGVNGTWTPTQNSIQPTCQFWDSCVGGMFHSQGVNDVTRLLFALFCIIAMMFCGMIVSKGNFGIGVTLAFIPYAFFAYLSMATPCGQYVPLWITIMIALITGIKMKWFS